MAQTKVNIGYSPAADFTPMFAAKDKGFFEKRGLDVTLTRIPLASNIPAAIVADSLQIGMGTGSMLVQTAGGRARPRRAERCIALPEIELHRQPGRPVRREDPEAGGLQGQEGRRAGTEQHAARHVQKWLLDNKVPLNQVTMIEAPFPQMNDMLKGGTIDAAVAIEPFRTRILSGNTGYRVADYVTEYRTTCSPRSGWPRRTRRRRIRRRCAPSARRTTKRSPGA